MRKRLGPTEVESVLVGHGEALKPEKILCTRGLPKTRSARIMRRVCRVTYLDQGFGDVSSLENPAVVKAVAEAT